MATVDELLGLTSEDKTLVIDNNLRTINIPRSVRSIGVSSDDEVLRLNFRMPRYYGEFDLSEFDIRINYVNALDGGDVYKVTDKKIGDTDITFSWLVGRFALVSKGDVEFNVCLKKIAGSGSDAVVVKEFNTIKTSLPVEEGLETIEQVIQRYPDLVETWQEELYGRFHGRIDESLSIPGMGADAAVTGKKIASVESSIENLKNNKADKTALDKEIRDRQTDVATERARIDKIVALKNGSTTGDAELQDARIDFEGVTHRTAGTSVRQTGKTLDRVKQRAYGYFESVECDIHNDAVYQVETKTEQSQSGGMYAEYDITSETMLRVSGFAWSSFSVFPLGAFYDADGNLLKKIGHTESKTYEQLLCYVPDGATLLIVNGKAWSEPEIEKFVAGDLESDINELKEASAVIESSRLKDYIQMGLRSEAIKLTADNTELLEAQMYDSWGSLVSGVLSGGTYDTLYLPVGSYESFLLSKYAIGVFGGAFVDENKKWISSFSTDYPNNLEAKIVPAGAHYIAITVHAEYRYATITGYRRTFGIDGLRINTSNVNNRWTGKKVVWIGTSVSFGQYASTSYPYEAAQHLGFELVNCSAPGLAIHTASDGSMLTYGSLVLSKDEYLDQGWNIPDEPIAYVPNGSYNNYYRTYENVFCDANADADLYVFDVAPNNGDFSVTDWDAFDFANWRYSDGSDFADHRTTFLGALLFLMDKMYALNENARMIFVLGSGFAYYEGKSAFQKVKDKWNIPIIDLWGKMNTSPKSYVKLKSQDGTNPHPSTFAHEIMGGMLAGEFDLIG